MSIRADVRYQTDIVLSEGEGLEKTLWLFRNKSRIVLWELKKRQRDGWKPSVKRRNKRWFSPQTKACTMASGERWTVRSCGYRPPPFKPK